MFSNSEGDQTCKMLAPHSEISQYMIAVMLLSLCGQNSSRRWSVHTGAFAHGERRPPGERALQKRQSVSGLWVQDPGVWLPKVC